VSTDGRTVVEQRMMSKGCQATRAPPNVQMAALYLNHVLDDMPVETDVFTSLSYFLPLFVLAGGEAWEVDGTRIRQMGVTFDSASDQPTSARSAGRAGAAQVGSQSS